MPISIDKNRGKKLARLLYDSFATVGIHGRNDMPEDIIPSNVEPGSLEHTLFITLTVSIDYMRDAPTLWGSSRVTFEDPDTGYLFIPEALHKNSFGKIMEDMQKHNLSKRPFRDANIWRTVGVTFYKKWHGDPRNFLEDCGWDSHNVLKRLESDNHLYNNRRRSDYPYLRGPKIGPLWLRMLRDNVGISSLKNLAKVPIPVDMHVARATLATGIVKGQAKAKLESLFEHIREAWFESVAGLSCKDKAMIALDVDEPLWHLSKYGCTKRDKMTGRCPVYNGCVAKEFCISGKVSIENKVVDLDT